eukprot:3913547-Lingulodinium_polyedra.AAC.1
MGLGRQSRRGQQQQGVAMVLTAGVNGMMKPLLMLILMIVLMLLVLMNYMVMKGLVMRVGLLIPVARKLM